MESPGFHLPLVRSLANVYGYEEIQFNETSRVIAFKDQEGPARINIYYTTRTVGTCLDHPHSGKTQLFRRNVSDAELRGLFVNMRMHTGRGYYRREQVQVNDEETELKTRVAALEEELDVCRARLASFELKRERKRLEAALALKLKEQEMKQKQEEERLRKMEEERKEESRRRSILTNKRGNNYDFRISWNDNFPRMADIKCVALSEGGFLAVRDNGTVNYHCAQTNVRDELDRQHYSHIDYIATGPSKQYFIQKTNGKFMFSASESFIAEITTSLNNVKFVTFGRWGNWVIVYNDGSSCWSYDIPPNLVKRIRSARVIDHIWIGVGGYKYLILYDGTWEYNGDLPQQVVARLSSSHKTKQFLWDEERNNWFQRYS